MNQACVRSESNIMIHCRYLDTALLIFEQRQQKITDNANLTYLSFGDSCQLKTFSSHGNEPIHYRHNRFKKSVQPATTRSTLCIIV